VFVWRLSVSVAPQRVCPAYLALLGVEDADESFKPLLSF
jgi:hypothetical protein